MKSVPGPFSDCVFSSCVLPVFQGLLQIEELQDHTGFYLLQQNAKEEAEQLVAEATNPNRSRKLVEVFDELSDCLCRVADMVGDYSRTCLERPLP